MNPENGRPELVLEFSANGKAAGTTVTARIGGDILACDRFDVAKAKNRAAFIDTLCNGRPGIHRPDVERLLTMEAAQFALKQTSTDRDAAGPDSADLLAKMPEHVRAEARAVLESSDPLKQIIDDVASLGVAGERELVATIYLIGVSRILPRPLAGIIQAPSSVGKSFTVMKTAELFPPETIIHATSLTPQALYYLRPGELAHRFVVAGEPSRKENDDTAETTRALREILSSGRLTKLVPEKEGGKIITKRIDQPGPIAYIETTTLMKVFDEDANRCLLLSADERDAQTRAVVNCLAASYAGKVTVNIERIVERHYALQRLLQRYQVIVPFAELVAERFDTARVEARRAFTHLMAMIQSSALLHQFQRQINSDGRLVAHADDYRLATYLVRRPLARLLGGRISDGALRFYERLAAWAPNTFSTTEAVRREDKSSQAIRGWLHELAEAGGVEQVELGKGCRPAIWKLNRIDRNELIGSGCQLPESIE